jgi:DNA topoisomerase-1
MRMDSSHLPVEEVVAQEAGLTYVSDAEPGIRREKAGKGFCYRHPNGLLVKDPSELQRIRSLAIPPAWADVWICPDASGHVQAVGRDAKGRKQYRYHPRWREVRDADKFDHMLDFARSLPRIRRQLEDDMLGRGVARERVLATIVSLLDKTLIRIGNDEYAAGNDSYGLTTLENRHLAVRGEELRFHFRGKSGKIWKLTIRDRRIARVVRTCQDLPGQRLFQYADDGGVVRTVTSTDVNEYLRQISGSDVSTKDFRTWAGTVLAAMALSAAGPAETQAEAKGKVRRAIEAVSARLGNTPSVCRKCYVHPDIIASYLEGDLPSIQAAEYPEPGESLPAEERAVLELLERRAREGRGAAGAARASQG